ncbi:MAG: DUF3006 domain-containing protein [Candidatus Falkowbacteria bacterium]
MNIKLTIDRFEGDKTVLITEDGQSIIWPKDKLPEKIHEGMILNFEINTDSDAEEKNKKLAKDILNEILDVEK